MPAERLSAGGRHADGCPPATGATTLAAANEPRRTAPTGAVAPAIEVTAPTTGATTDVTTDVTGASTGVTAATTGATAEVTGATADAAADTTGAHRRHDRAAPTHGGYCD